MQACDVSPLSPDGMIVPCPVAGRRRGAPRERRSVTGFALHQNNPDRINSLACHRPVASRLETGAPPGRDVIPLRNDVIPPRHRAVPARTHLRRAGGTMLLSRSHPLGRRGTAVAVGQPVLPPAGACPISFGTGIARRGTAPHFVRDTSQTVWDTSHSARDKVCAAGDSAPFHPGHVPNGLGHAPFGAGHVPSAGSTVSNGGGHVPFGGSSVPFGMGQGKYGGITRVWGIFAGFGGIGAGLGFGRMCC
jgi:hypothetical protein